MRLGLVGALCAISAAIGAAIDHYWDDLRLLLQPKPSETVQTTTPPSQEKKVEVLPDRVRGDVRFTELSLPVSEYRSFFDGCMGSAALATEWLNVEGNTNEDCGG
jgi:hypothetical protein